MKRILKRTLISLAIALPLLAIGIISGGLLMTQTTTPANPAAGHNKLYFKSDNKLYSLTSAGTEAEIGAGGGGTAYDPTDPQWMYHADEFMSFHNQNSSNSGWISSQMKWYLHALAGTTSSVLPLIATQTDTTNGYKHGGIAEFCTGASSNNAAIFALDTFTGKGFWLDTSKLNWKLTWVFRLTTTTQQYFVIGAGNEYSNIEPPTVVGVKNDSTTAETNFFYFIGMYGGGSPQTYDTGIVADATTWHTLTVRADDTTAGKVWLKLDSATERSVCASGCDMTQTMSGYLMQSEVRLKTKEAVTKCVDLDYYGAKMRTSATAGIRQ